MGFTVKRIRAILSGSKLCRVFEFHCKGDTFIYHTGRDTINVAPSIFDCEQFDSYNNIILLRKGCLVPATQGDKKGPAEEEYVYCFPASEIQHIVLKYPKGSLVGSDINGTRKP